MKWGTLKHSKHQNESEISKNQKKDGSNKKSDDVGGA